MLFGISEDDFEIITDHGYRVLVVVVVIVVVIVVSFMLSGCQVFKLGNV